ncbi:hypothetical protein N9J72_00820 [Candidatus Gracilibacteria bacterium]|nr:hypothetical protein [Candidatus Gracilibacteria bacterium]
MGQIALFFGTVVFFTWFFQYLDIPRIEFLQIPFLKEFKFKGIISTFQMFTTVGAIFAFWYGYKKYERDKKYQFISNLNNDERYLTQLLQWFSSYTLKEEGDLDIKLFEIVENNAQRVIIGDILSAESLDHVNGIVSTILYTFNNNEYINKKLIEMKTSLENSTYIGRGLVENNKNEFIRIIGILESNNFET